MLTCSDFPSPTKGSGLQAAAVGRLSPQEDCIAMALQSIYGVLKEKEAQLHELQRLLNEAQAVLGRVLELDAAMSGLEMPALETQAFGEGNAEGEEGAWGGNGSTEFP
jgi:hypothetical protein